MWPIQVCSVLICFASTQAISLYGPPKDATLLERPFQAAIFKNDHYQCSAALVSEHCVLTACSCIVDKSIDLEETESIDISYTIVTYTRYLYVKQINWGAASDALIVDGCDISSNENDAALLCSKKKLVGVPVTIIKEKTEENVRGIVSGWGLSVKGQPMIQNEMHRAYMKIISLEECRRRYAGVRQIPDSALCAVATDEVRGFCGGDLGAPLTHGEGLIGIAVSEFGCGRFNYPGIFTNVSMISDFIEDAIE